VSGSLHNVEVFRCSECGEQVALSPEGFVLTDDELDAMTRDHAEKCAPLRERMARAED
jgi:hypothetical protein